ncbi:MAG: hypothetical protein AAGJ87_05530 [Pseudomonadota bacterium]
MTERAPDNKGWNLSLALGVAGFLSLVLAMIIAIGVRLFDTFDTVTEILIGGVVFLVFIGVNAAVIFYLNAMPNGGPAKQAGAAQASLKSDNSEGSAHE